MGNGVCRTAITLTISKRMEGAYWIGKRAVMFRAALDGSGTGRLAAARLRLTAWLHWVWPLAVCAAFITAGLLVLDDYAVTGDAIFFQRLLAINTFNFALGAADALPADDNKFYGAAFEVLPLLVERIAGLDDTRAIYLTRHLMTHLLFISAGFCCYLLAYRMTGSRLLGLFAMLLFLLHPRIYAHSFFNSKDLPFLSMFMIALLCVHWAFRKGTLGAFVVCGVAVGILVNLRIMGIMLLPAVLSMRACDVYYAVGWAERRRAVISGAAFALTAAVIYYASMPYLWADPLSRFAELLATLSRHPHTPYELFQGQYVYAADLPALYLPVWLGITTPPWALLLAGLGAVGICWRAVTPAGAALRNTARRFELLLVGCAALPIIAVIALQSTMYSDWLHMYFLWTPLCLLAVVGLRQAGDGLAALTRHSGLMRHSGWRRNGTVARVVLAALAALALAAIVAEMIRLHPYQHLYFNLLVDRNTPEYLKTQYRMDYSHSIRLEGYQYILDNHPDETIQMEWRGAGHPIWRYLEIYYTAFERRRFQMAPETDADYYVLEPSRWVVNPPGLPAPLLPPSVYDRKVYNNTIMSVTTPDLSRVDPDIADAYREISRAATQREPALRADFDFYLNDKTLTLVNEDCPPGALRKWYGLRVYPIAQSDLPNLYRERGHIHIRLYGVRFDGKCLMQAALPDYGIARIEVVGIGGFWTERYLAELRQQYAALQETEPAIRSQFVIYMADGTLTYMREDCAAADTEAVFFLHIIPSDVNDLPEGQREHGFGNLDFEFGDAGGVQYAGRCRVSIPLPDYAIDRIHTGQYRPDTGRLWEAEFAVAE